MTDGTLRTCDYEPCDARFERGGRKRYCCRDHKERARDLRARTSRPPCVWCGKTIDPRTHGATRLHPGCAWARQRQMIALDHANRGRRPVPLDLRAGLLGEHVRNSEVAAYLRHVKYLDPCSYCSDWTSESLDHIDPLDGRERRTERGALRAAAHNLTGACMRCNSTKNEQPLLLHLLAERVRADLDPLARELGRITGGEVASIELLRSRPGRLKLRRVA